MGPTALLPLRRKACWGFFRPEKSNGFCRVWTRELGYQRPTIPLSQNWHLSNYPCKWTARWWHQYFRWSHFRNLATPKYITYRATEVNYHKIWLVRVGFGRSWIPTPSNKNHLFLYKYITPYTRLHDSSILITFTLHSISDPSYFPLTQWPGPKQ